jgi:hypothetical protein
MSAEVAHTDAEPTPSNHIRATFEVTDIDKPWEFPSGHSIHVFEPGAETSLCGHVDADQHPTSLACDADHDRPLTYDVGLCDHCARSVRKRVRESELTTGYDDLDAVIETEVGDELEVEAGGEIYTFTVEETGFSINSVHAKGETGREAPEDCEYWCDTAKIIVKPDGTTTFRSPYNILEGSEEIPAAVKTEEPRAILTDGGEPSEDKHNTDAMSPEPRYARWGEYWGSGTAFCTTGLGYELWVDEYCGEQNVDIDQRLILPDGGVSRGDCESCGQSDVPLRRIKIRDGGRELLCQSCFLKPVENNRVDPSDPRIETMVGGDYA